MDKSAELHIVPIEVAFTYGGRSRNLLKILSAQSNIDRVLVFATGKMIVAQASSRSWFQESLTPARTMQEKIPMNPSNPSILPLLLSDKQVAALLGCHRNTIWNRVRKDQIPQPIKWEGKTVWRRSEIEKFVETLCT